MNQKSFEDLMKFWALKKENALEDIQPQRTVDCLSFTALENYAEGQFDSMQERHVTACSHCQEMVALFKKHQKTSVYPDFAKAKGAIEVAARWREKIRAAFEQFRFPKTVVAGIPIAVTLALVLLFFLPQQANYVSLARIEPVPFRSLQLKSGASASDAERLFYQGMAAYVQKDYAGATEILLLAVRNDSTDADFHFYLGLSYLLSDQIDPAIHYLQQATKLAGGNVQEKAFWYLGNAWLLKEEPKLALEALQKVVNMEGDFLWDAEELIGKIENLSPD